MVAEDTMTKVMLSASSPHIFQKKGSFSSTLEKYSNPLQQDDSPSEMHLSMSSNLVKPRDLRYNFQLGAECAHLSIQPYSLSHTPLLSQSSCQVPTSGALTQGEGGGQTNQGV